jgi:hypothetical protein
VLYHPAILSDKITEVTALLNKPIKNEEQASGKGGFPYFLLIPADRSTRQGNSADVSFGEFN